MEHGETRIEYVVIALRAVTAVGCTYREQELVGPGNGFRMSWIHVQSATRVQLTGGRDTLATRGCVKRLAMHTGAPESGRRNEVRNREKTHL